MAFITSSVAENFGTVNTADNGAAITVSHFSLFFNFGVAGELLLYTGALAVSRTFTAGDPIELPAGSLDINIPAGDLEDNAVKAAWDALIAEKANLTMILGRASLGANGKGSSASRMPSNRGYSDAVVELSTGTGAAPTS